jgi:CBS domain containing-hemolysin-like protein
MDAALVTVGLKVLLAVGLVLLNGFFVAAELALIKIRETQLDALVARGQPRARVARYLKSNLSAAISATQLGITLASLLLGWLVNPLVYAALAPVVAGLKLESAGWLHSVVFFLAFALFSFTLIVAGEMVPKAIALRKTSPVALWTASPLNWFRRLTLPCIWIINRSAQWILRQLGVEAVSGEGGHSEEELRLLFLASQGASASTALGREIVLNALELRHRVARQVMRPRREIVSLSTAASLAECLEVAEKTRYSRFPLCQGGDLDKTLGVVHIKDLYALRHKARTATELLPVARKLIYVPETARLEKLLQLLQERKLHLAIVVDEYGGTVGMVTLENVLEELVGQIQDEFDQEKPLAVRMADNAWELQGALPLHELAEIIGQPLPAEGITTVSGLVTHRLGGFPHAGDTLMLGAWELRVEETDNLRVAKLRLTRPPVPAPEPPADTNQAVRSR